MRRVVAGGVFPPLALALIAFSRATLLGWETSPYGRYLHHEDWKALGLAGAICTTLPAGISCSPRRSMRAGGT